MENINTYIEHHIESKEYRRRIEGSTLSFENTLNWADFIISENMIFSHRNTYYTASTFRDKFHAHDFCEVVIYLAGDIKYLSECREMVPEPFDIMISAPGTSHTASLNKQSRYERYVFYFSTAAFGSNCQALDAVLTSGPFIRLDPAAQNRLSDLLFKIDHVLSKNAALSTVMAYSYILQVFCLLIDHGNAVEWTMLSQKLIAIREYIDANLTSITSISLLAAHFHYSREYFSRMFRKGFNIPVSEYISSKRLSLAHEKLKNGASVTSACYDTGFSNVSFFIQCFREKYGVTPHQFAKHSNTWKI